MSIHRNDSSDTLDKDLPLDESYSTQVNLSEPLTHSDEKSAGKSMTVDMPDIDMKNENGSMDEDEDEDDDIDKPSRLSVLYNRYRPWFHLAEFLIFTGFLAAAYALQVPKGYDQENLILGLLYAWFCIFMIFNYIPTSTVTVPWMRFIRFVGRPIMRLTKFQRNLFYGFFVTAVIVVTVFSLPESPDSTRLQRLVALFGLFVFFAVLWATSTARRKVNWNTIFSGILIQFILALFVFRCTVGQDIFQWLSTFAQSYLGMSYFGTQFVFGDDAANSGVFAVSVFPALIFFAATVQILYYYGALQWLLQKCAIVFVAVLQVSGAESIVAVASPFLGQCENALLIKPFLPYLTSSEMHQVMCSGFATISGSVLYGYIAMGVDGQALLTSCIMSIPCSLAVSKMRMPETDVPITANDVTVPPSDEKASSALHAASSGAATGINIALLICANLITLLALLYAVNAGLTWLGNFLNINELTLQLITGYLFVPISWLIGVDSKDVVPVGQLLATKIWANEFVAYDALTTTYKDVLSERSTIVVTYALCGFANLGSVGMQIGVLSTLAPKRSGEIARLAVSAMICGAFSTWISAAIAGMLL